MGIHEVYIGECDACGKQHPDGQWDDWDDAYQDMQSTGWKVDVCCRATCPECTKKESGENA